MCNSIGGLDMIDDKKIEVAAREAADLYEQVLPIMSYNEDTEVDGQHHFCQEFGAELFKEGAKWAINEFLKSLWHDAEEEPKKKRVFLYKTIFEGYGINQIIDGNEWKYIIKYQRATQWLYIDDLLPKKEAIMIKPVTMYSVVCDRCGKPFIDEFNGIVAWLDEGTAKEQAMESEWVEIGDKHYCPDCYEFNDNSEKYVPKKKGFKQ